MNAKDEDRSQTELQTDSGNAEDVLTQIEKIKKQGRIHDQ